MIQIHFTAEEQAFIEKALELAGRLPTHWLWDVAQYDHAVRSGAGFQENAVKSLLSVCQEVLKETPNSDRTFTKLTDTEKLSLRRAVSLLEARHTTLLKCSMILSEERSRVEQDRHIVHLEEGEWSILRKISSSRGRRWIASILTQDGRRTSPITSIEGNVVKTASGTTYILKGSLAPLLSREPFCLWGGGVFPTGAEVPLPPPAVNTYEEAFKAYPDQFVLVWPDGEWEVMWSEQAAMRRAEHGTGRVFLNGVEHKFLSPQKSEGSEVEESEVPQGMEKDPSGTGSSL